MASLVVQNSSLADPRPAVYSRTSLRLTITTGGGHPVTADPAISSPPHFQLEAADGSLLLSMSREHCQLHARFHGACLIARCTGPPQPWSASGLGPEGFAAAVPAALTGLHWFVHSLATPMRFSLCQPGVPVVHGAAVAHFEKNWGRSFPSAWIWAQGLITLWDFHPWNSIFTAQSSPCPSDTTLLLTASQPLTRRGVEVQIRARRSSFAEVECPTREGFRPFSEESFTAAATVRLFEYRIGGSERGGVQKQLLEAFEFEGAALEFGGAARCHHTDAGVALEAAAA
ncbi:hypothetical protein CHLNCDRAFT_137022 [Chlorella variabilis]|uniref:Uncharacterized protein n=1 Tax=Chlorella variabilis TaxID=554065 RepID=E1ZLT9_CHLVA|nr:hypothetical protein CHLNCDRAFT_137022 [Chlorella variabilis]EFN53194.1 hypothetical protein CHLNCDRAFT_137022 [Chlorella variabilis]|eukprot:XP_005845296.1 hypothetical protein CHLNCDRAFT_137022 [Chlorella variabilis]